MRMRDNIKNVEDEKSSSTVKKEPKKKSSRIRITSDVEQQEWEALYEYIRTDILKYEKDMILPRSFCLRLKGLAQGKLVAKKRTEAPLVYGYTTIMETLLYYRPIISSTLSKKTFNNESHKINWLFRFVETHINDLYVRKLEALRQNEFLNNSNIIQTVKDNAKRLDEIRSNDKYVRKQWSDEDEDLW